jgi:outer membrane lipoprotein-sorting protein
VLYREDINKKEIQMKMLLTGRVIPKFFLIAFSLLAIVVSACTPAQARQLEGLLQNIDTVNGTVTITTKEGKTVTATIDNNTVTLVDGSNSSVFNLEPGIKVRIDEDKGVVRLIDDKSASVEGTIASVQGNQVTITPKRGANVTVNVTAQTKIQLESDQTGTLGDLKVGAKVAVKYDSQTKDAIRIMVNTHQKAEIEGTITQISGGNVTVQTRRGLQTIVVVDNNTSIRLLRGQTGTLSDLTVGLHVHARFDTTSRAALRIEVQGQESNHEEQDERDDEDRGGSQQTRVEGIITAISGNSIMVRTEKGDVAITADGTGIRVKGTAGTLADLKVGMRIQARVNSSGVATQIQAQSGS